MHTLNTLTHYKDFHEDFFKEIVAKKLLPIYKTVEKIVAVVKKICSVYGQ